MSDLSIDDIVWLAGEFSRPPLTREQLHNLRTRLELEQESAQKAMAE